ncbi:MAG: hypothetical protein KAY37_09485 [Phycisphaerae bacterium]|nr:hypothetical protein [Phycisphaerae bacterium]
MKDDRVYLLHIRDFEIVGEAAKNLSQVHKDAHPGIPWKRIAPRCATAVSAVLGREGSLRNALLTEHWHN